MNKLLNYILILFLASSLTSCSKVLQSVDLEIKSKDFSLQEEFSVIEKTLTIKEAKAQNATHYPRIVLRNGRGQVAQPISEELALKSGFPRNLPVEYKIGVGDTITFSRLIENNRSTLNKQNWPKQTVATKYKLGIGDTLVLTIIKRTLRQVL